MRKGMVGRPVTLRLTIDTPGDVSSVCDIVGDSDEGVQGAFGDGDGERYFFVACAVGDGELKRLVEVTPERFGGRQARSSGVIHRCSEG
jgi:hypothetical protein